MLPGGTEPPDPFAFAADVLDPPPDEDRALAIECASNLGTFIRQAWPILEPATPFVDGWHVDVMAEHLEAVSAGELRRLIINIPPRAMKSLTTAVFWPSWDWLEHASLRWLFATYASELSLRDSLKMRRLIETQGGREEGTIFQRIGYQGVLRLLNPAPWELAGDQNAKGKYENTETGFRLATSVDAMATGEGGDRVVVDDALSADQSRSDAKLKHANTWWSGTMSTRFNNDAAAAVIVMQRLHEEDLTGYLLERGDWHHLCLPAEYEPKHPFVYPSQVKLPSGRELPGDPRTEEGELLEPVRLGHRKLAELLREQGSYGYAGQLQQRPAPAEGGMFKKHWWKRWDEDSLPPRLRKVASWDMRFSDSQSEASSYVVGQVWGVRGADRYLLGMVRARLGFSDSKKALKAMEKWQPCTAKLVEKKANGDAIIQTLRHEIPGLIPVEPHGTKEARAAAVEPIAEAGNIYLPASEFIPVPPGYEPTRTDEFVHECAVFPNGAHDDQVDAMSQFMEYVAGAPVSAPIVRRKASRWRG